MLRLALAQANTDIAAFDANSRIIIDYIQRASAAGADIVVFPELCVTGYPPEDLLLKPEFAQRSMSAMRTIAESVGEIVAVVGFVECDYDIFNSAAVLNRGDVLATYRKTFLPNYGVFDEKRYFGTGIKNLVVEVGGSRVGVTICEDIWFPGGPVEQLVARGGADMVVNLSASPFHRGKEVERERLIQARAMDGPVVIAYVNMVGGQDELVFDVGSCVCHPQSGFIARAGRFHEELLLCDIDFSLLKRGRTLEPRFRYSTPACPHDVPEIVAAAHVEAGEKEPLRAVESPGILTAPEEIFEALVLGLREYTEMNGFKGVILGLSGGIDSALTAALAVEALGKKNVHCVFLPSRFTSDISGELAAEVASNLGVDVVTMPISGVFESYTEALKAHVADGEGVVFENIQARIRGNLIMALSNRFGWLVLATGNKSELSMGYCTLYGDMAGGFALIKDLLKGQVYELAYYINERSGSELIPLEIIERPPTAELRDDQLDTDTLPPYEVLDGVLEAYVEEGLSAEDMIALRGFDRDMVERIIATVDANEYKRRQAPVGIKVTSRAFGRDWRMPVSRGKRGPIS